jgi:long-chain acyl-CoA synthetase
MYPGAHAVLKPDAPAVIMARTGETMTYAELDAASNRFANLLFDAGLRPGDHIAFVLENSPIFFVLVWAAQRSGLYYTPVSTRLLPHEVEYIVGHCGAKALVVSGAREDLLTALDGRLPQVTVRLTTGAARGGWRSYADDVGGYPTTPLETELEGVDMLYSSGTTGRPKGVRRPLTGNPAGTADNAVWMLQKLFGCDGDTVFLSTAPLYHGAPLVLGTAVHRLGGALVVMERFNPIDALECIELYRVTHSQFVPTMFVRLLKLPAEHRTRYDLSSHRLAVHGAGPCPIEVKRAMIDWWGPILFDYYSGTEGAGVCAITSEEWLQHPGSVGRAVIGTVHILDDAENECEPGETGTVYFEGGPAFEYLDDPEATAASRNERGWTTLGDVGYRDSDGYVYLTDRRAFTIVSGGVNVYPQEIENVLVMHPAVHDVAVFGVPDDDLVEVTKAVVQPAHDAVPGPELAAELIAYCRERLASYKLPRSIDFIDELPRHATGTLYKAELRRQYMATH